MKNNIENENVSLSSWNYGSFSFDSLYYNQDNLRKENTKNNENVGNNKEKIVKQEYFDNLSYEQYMNRELHLKNEFKLKLEQERITNLERLKKKGETFDIWKKNKKKQIKNETPKKSENNNENDIKDTIEKKEEIIPKIDVLKDIGSSKCLRTAKGHKGPVYCIIGLNNDLYEDCIISGGFDNLIKIFKIQEDNKVIDLVGHENTVTFLTLSDSKKFLLSSSFDFTIRKWDLDQCSCIKVIKYNPGIQNILLPMMNDFLLSVGYDGKVNIWNDEGFMVKNYYFQHGAITTGTLFPVKNDNERNMFVFADHTGEIFIKQIIVGDEDIKNFNKSRKKVEAKKISIRKSIKSKDKI